MKILICGFGSIARRHFKNILSLGSYFDIMVFPHHEAEVDEEFRGKCLIARDIEECLVFDPDAVIIAVPTAMHIPYARQLMASRGHFFIEKPLSDSTEGVHEFIAECRNRNKMVLTAYNFRFYRPLQIIKNAVAAGVLGKVIYARAEVGQYLPDWRPGTDYRQTTSSSKSLGGGVLLELSHEIDYLLWILGEADGLYAELGRLSDLDMDVEDSADILMTMKNSVKVSLHMDMYQRKPYRMLRVVGDKGTIVWNYENHDVDLFEAGNPADKKLFHGADMDRNAMYLDEMKHFLLSIKRSEELEIDPDDALKVLQVIEAARRSDREGKYIRL